VLLINHNHKVAGAALVSEHHNLNWLHSLLSCELFVM